MSVSGLQPLPDIVWLGLCCISPAGCRAYRTLPKDRSLTVAVRHKAGKNYFSRPLDSATTSVSYIVYQYIVRRYYMTTDQFQRDLLRGSLELMVLAVLADGQQYGYLIQKLVCQRSGNLARLTAGTLYPLLHRLEAQKVVRSRIDKTNGRRRKWYELTAAGRKRLRKQAGYWRHYTQSVMQVVDPAIAALG